MNFMQLLNSLDELLYALMSWLVFYPITFWRVVRGPLRMTDYALRELAKKEERQFEDTISPPLFLLITLLLSHAISQTLLGDNPLIKDRHGLAVLVTDQTSLLVVQLLFFSLFPLLAAVQLVRAQRHRFTQETLKLPFYSQCYVTGPFALSLGLATIVTQIDMRDGAPGYQALAGLALIVAVSAWYLKVQTRWFAKHLETSLWRGFAHALTASVLSGIAFVAAAFLFA